MKAQLEAHFDTMSAITLQYEQKVSERINIEEKIEFLTTGMLKYERDAKSSVLNEIDPITNKRKHPNEEARNLAVIEKLELEPEYVSIKREVDDLHVELRKVKGELDYVAKRITVLNKQADLLVALTNFKIAIMD